MGSIYKTKGPAPQGLQDSAQGFNPGNPQNKRFALKGREIGYPVKVAKIAAQKSECVTRTCDNWPIGPHFRLVRTFDLVPLQHLQPGGRVFFHQGATR